MTRRERGATVSVMWVIFLIVLLLGAGAYIYAVQSEITTAKTAEDRAKRDLAAFEARLFTEQENHLKLSDVIGFKDASADVNSSVSAIEQRIEQIKGKYTNDIGSADSTVETILDRLASIADARRTEADDLRSQFDTEVAKRGDAETAKDEIRSSMDSQLSKTNSELRDARDAASSQKQQDDSRVAGLQDQLDEANAKMREVQTTADAKVADLEQEKTAMTGRVAALSEKAKLIGYNEDPYAVDGSVISVGALTRLVFIDVGSRDLLRPGVRFDVFYYGKGGEMLPKGNIEVREVENDSAVAVIVNQIDDLNPIARGDVIANPLFNKERSKVFALLGNFPVQGRSFLETRLRAIGAEVQDDVNANVDFVVLGQKAPEEDAPELAELDGYKAAQELSIQMLRIADIERFLKQ